MDVHMDVRSMIGHTPVLKLNNIGIENKDSGDNNQ